jgi:putative transposase
MPWKTVGRTEARRAFLELYWNAGLSLAEVCRRCGISRKTGYALVRRAVEEGWTLEDRSHRTKKAAALHRRWFPRVVAMRRSHSFAGAAKLRWHLQQKFPLGPCPGVRTLGRWLQSAHLTARRDRHARPGPVIVVQRRRALAANDLWTIDFKGSFRAGNGQRVHPLTVRDWACRFVLLVRHMECSAEREVRHSLSRLFRRYGVPRAIRTDNGPPFGGAGPYGWSALCVWWVRLGIEVIHGRPGCPQDNAAHEQMHQVLQKETAQPAAPTVAAQQRRFDRWRKKYNRRRPHEALGMHPPVALYQPSPRPLQLQQWRYPAAWKLKRTDPRGRLTWRNRPRLIGKAFGRQFVALKLVRPDVAEVYFGPHLLGELHAGDHTAIRAVRCVAQTGGKAAASPANPRYSPGKGGSKAPSLKPSPSI